jgi:transcription elongation factor Elf1
MWEAIDEVREYVECPHCGFKGVGTVFTLANDLYPSVSVGVCDVCEKRHDLNEEGV